MRKITKREKRIRAEAREYLKEKGILAPDKKKLSRKSFIEEAKKEIEKFNYEMLLNLVVSLTIVMDRRDRNLNISTEAIGAAKAVKLAVRLTEFEEKVKERGETKYSAEEQFEYIKDIYEA